MSKNADAAAQEKQLLLLLEEALDQPPSTRQAWLSDACPAHLLERALGLLRDMEAEEDDATLPLAAAVAALSADALSNEGDGRERTADALPPGHIIKDRFVIDSPLGEGGMGMVYRARDLRKEETQDSDPWVAVKVLGPRFRTNPMMVMALQREARKAQTLAHPNIATVYDFDRDGDLVYLTMELLLGETLEDFIARHPQGADPETLKPIIRGLSLGLAYAHNKAIIHSDFKPGNIFLTQTGGVKILDFGIARAAPLAEVEEGKQETHFDAGKLGALTPAYAALEMFDAATPHPADDVYALAVVSYQLHSGKHPFEKLSSREAHKRALKPAVLRGIRRREWRAIMRGLAYERAQRTQHAAEFLREYEGMPRVRFAATALAIALVVTLCYAGYQAVVQRLAARPAVAFGALPTTTQAQIQQYLTEGARFKSFGDYSAALDYFHRAYQLHPRNQAAVTALEDLFETLLDLSQQADDPHQWQVLAENLATIRETDGHLHNNAVLTEVANRVSEQLSH